MERQVETTCAYCGVGCGVRATVREDKLLAVSGSESHPANLGQLCVKGSALHETFGTHGRLLRPRVAGEEVSWDAAISEVAHRLAKVRADHGPGAIAFYLSGQLLTEDYYVANKLAKGFLGTGHVDTNSRLCMSSAVAAHKRAFGADAVPCSYEDLEQCDLLVLTGSNAAWTHPVLYRRMAAAKARNPDMRIVVLDPRSTATCDIADLHLAIAPGTDGFVFTGLLAWLEQAAALDRSFIDRHTLGLEEALKKARGFTPERIARTAGVSQKDLVTFFRWFAATEKTVTFFSQGVNQSSTGTDKCNAILNCHLATGRIGRPGMGPFSITGQPNAMGGREVGGLANTLAAHMDYSAEHRALVAEFWHTDTLSEGPGYKAVDLFEAVARGEIRAIWIMGTNPVVSMPDADRVQAALRACETVIVSDCIAETDTTACADILLPAAGWGEKSGTVTNSERRISRQRALVPAAGEARPDWWILTQVGRALGYEQAFPYQHPRDIFVEHAALSGFRNGGTRLFDISGLADIDEPAYDALTPVQWPVHALQPRGTTRLFGDGRFATPDHRARFVAVEPRQPQRAVSRRYPLALNTGRVRDQWHTMTRTGRSERLMSHVEAPYVQLHPETARAHGVADGDLCEVTTRNGAVRVLANGDESMQPGHLFVPIHWNDRFSSMARVSATVAALTDPLSGQPEFKHTPAQIAPVRIGGWALLASRETTLPMEAFPFWCVLPRTGSAARLYLVAFGEDQAWESWARDHDRVSETHFSRHDSDDGADFRYLGLRAGQLEVAVFAASRRTALPSTDWLGELLGPGPDGAGPSWRVLAGPSADEQAQGRKICSCYNVGERQIVEAIIAGAHTVGDLGCKLKCGTNCGSCIPELKLLIQQSEQAGAA